MRIRPSILALIFIAACLGVLASVYLFRVAQDDTVAELLTRMPEGDGTVVYADLRAMRENGLLDLLAGTGIDEDPDYRNFVEETGFDYRTDLDSVLASFHGTDSFFLARGRFRWMQLNRYSESNGGNCRNALCQGMRTGDDIRISFWPLTYRTIAMAASTDPWAAMALETRHREPGEWVLPDAPLWASVPARQLLQSEKLPAGTQSFARALSAKDRVVLSLGPDGPDYSLKATVDCDSAAEAAALASELQRVTDLLRSLIRREDKTPNPDDLSGMLTSGVFEHSGFTVIGRWPVTRAFLSGMAAGGTQEQRGAE